MSLAMGEGEFNDYLSIGLCVACGKKGGRFSGRRFRVYVVGGGEGRSPCWSATVLVGGGLSSSWSYLHQGLLGMFRPLHWHRSDDVEVGCLLCGFGS